jgi:mono/diheme cytochrome c family protein
VSALPDPKDKRLNFSSHGWASVASESCGVVTLFHFTRKGEPPMHKSSKVTGAILTFVVFALALALESLGRGQGQQNPPAKAQASPPPTQVFSKNTWDIPADADKTKNPVEATEESIVKGKEIFMMKKGNCIFCHGETGAGNEANLAKLRRKPADLSDQKRMSELSDGNLFWKITKGIPGIMPGREQQLTEEERWQVVNFVRTLAKEKPKS